MFRELSLSAGSFSSSHRIACAVQAVDVHPVMQAMAQCRTPGVTGTVCGTSPREEQNLHPDRRSGRALALSSRGIAPPLAPPAFPRGFAVLRTALPAPWSGDRCLCISRSSCPVALPTALLSRRVLTGALDVVSCSTVHISYTSELSELGKGSSGTAKGKQSSSLRCRQAGRITRLRTDLSQNDWFCLHRNSSSAPAARNQKLTLQKSKMLRCSF